MLMESVNSKPLAAAHSMAMVLAPLPRAEPSIPNRSVQKQDLALSYR